VGDHHDGGAGPPDRVERRQHLVAGGGVELAGRLVREQQARPSGQPHGERQPLALTRRESLRARAVAFPPRQADHREHLARLWQVGTGGAALGEPHVLLGGQIWQEVACGALEDDTAHRP
jgi:hypothetical protein